jgi:hypothetical protein
MKILLFFKDYWVQIVFLVGIVLSIIKLEIAYREGTKCSLRNDMLQIYNTFKENKEIPLYDFEAFSLSYGLYKKYKGNSFVDSIWSEIQTWKKI